MKLLPNLLIVDDSVENLLFLETLIRKVKVNLIKAVSGPEALEKTRGIDLALAILDVRMPGMDGYELAMRMNEEREVEKVPIIFLTADNGSGVRLMKGYESGAVDYISKPVDIHILQCKINIFLDIFRQKQTIIHKAEQLEKSTQELLRVNTALKMSEEKYRGYIDNAPDGVFVIDENGKFVDLNLAAPRISGYLKDNLLKMSVADLFPEESAAAGLILFSDLYKTGSLKADLPFIHKNGTKRWWAVEAVKITGSRFLVFVKDITQRVEIEEILRNNQIEVEMQNEELQIARSFAMDTAEKYSELYEFAPSAYFTLSTDQTIKELNHRGAQMLGKERLFLVNSRFADFISKNTLPVFDEFFVKVLNKKSKEICEVIIEAEGKKPKYVHVEGVVVGKGTQCLLTLVDITERKKAESDIYTANSFLDSIVDNIPNMVFVKDAKSLRFVRVNRWGTELLGIPKEELIGKNDYDFFPKEHADSFTAKDQEVLKGREILNITEEPIVTRNRGKRILNTKKVPILNPLGEPEYLLGISEDITERKILEDLLEQNRLNYEIFFNSIDDFLFVLNLEGKFIHVNTKVKERLGYTNEELLGQSVLMIHPSERQDEVKRIFAEMLVGEIEFYPVPVITKNGIQIPVETRVTHGFWNGKPAIFGAGKDVSLIKLSEEKFSKVFYINPSACSLTDELTGNYVEVNDAFSALLGFEKTEVIGKTSLELGIVTPDILNDLLSRVDPNEKVVNMETSLIAKNGSVRNVLLSSEKLLLQENNYLFTVAHDITSLKQAGQALKVNEEKYRTMLNASPDGILLINLKGIITEVSEIGLELFGADKRDDFLGTDIFLYIPSEEKNNLIGIFEKTMIEGLVQNAGLIVRKKNNALFASEASVTLIQGPEGEPVSFMVIIRDISQRKKMEAKQIHSDRMANLGEMASGIAHEINQPLNIISMVMDKILFESAKTKTIDIEFLKMKSDKIFENIIRMRNIIDHIRAFSRSHDDYVLSAFDINSSIENAVSMILEQFKYLGITLNLHLGKKIPQIVGNTYKFEQVILNLLINAKDAVIERKGKDLNYVEMVIGLKSYMDNQSVIVEITDNGIGIGNDDINNIMLPFYTTKDEGKGTGLGLSICYQIIKEMNGSIEITSQNSDGTKIMIVLNILKSKQEH